MNEIINAIIEQAEANGLTRFGIRQHHEQVSIGDNLPTSTDYIDDCDPVELDGTCCLEISYDGFEVEDIEWDIEQLKKRNYHDGQIILVGGTDAEEGNDEWEIVIESAVCLYVF